MNQLNTYKMKLKCEACSCHEWNIRATLEANENQKIVKLTCPECGTERKITITRKESAIPIKGVRDKEEE